MRLSLLPIASIMCVCASVPGNAKVLTLSPSQYVVLADDESGNAVLAFEFDLTEVEDLATNRIEMATVGVELEGLSTEDAFAFDLRVIGEAWSTDEVGSALTKQQLEPSAVDASTVTPLDWSRGAGSLRFDVTEMARSWQAEPNSNHGIAIVSTDVSRSIFVSNERTVSLVIYYGTPPVE